MSRDAHGCLALSRIAELEGLGDDLDDEDEEDEDFAADAEAEASDDDDDSVDEEGQPLVVDEDDDDEEVCVDFMAGIMRWGTVIAPSMLDAVGSPIHGSSFSPASDRGPGSIRGSLGPGRAQPFGGAVRALEPSNGITSSCNFELPAHMHSVSFHRLSHFRPPTNYAAFGQTLAPLRPGITASRLPLLAMAKQDTKPAKRAKKAEEPPARKSKASAAAEGKVPEWVCSHGSRCREMCGVDFFGGGRAVLRLKQA